MQYHQMNISQLRVLLDTKQLSAPALTRYFLERISTSNGYFISVCAERAMEQAVKAQERINQGNVRMLTGIPIAVEDNFSTRFLRTTCSSDFLEWYVPPYDNTIMRKLDGYGAVLLGKLNMGEFGTTPSMATDCVNEGYALCALGAYFDDNGSYMIPTSGAVSRDGFITIDGNLAQIGVCAKKASDCGIVLDAITDFDPYDTTMNRPNSYQYNCKIGESLQGLRIAYDQESPIVDALLHDGCVMSCVAMDLALANAAYLALSAMYAASALSGYDGTTFGECDSSSAQARAQGFMSVIKKRILLGTLLANTEYANYEEKAGCARQRLKAMFAGIFAQYDAYIAHESEDLCCALRLCGLPYYHLKDQTIMIANYFCEELLLQLANAQEEIS